MSVDPVFIGIAGDSGAGKSTFVKDIATLLGRDKVLEAMFRHPLTDIGIEKFLSDWKGLQESK